MMTKKSGPRSQSNQEGFVLVGALLIMVLLVIVGLSALTNTSLDLQIAGNDRVHTETFYQADGGTQLAGRLVEENLGSTGGFTATTTVGTEQVLNDSTNPNTTIVVANTTFSHNEDMTRDQSNVSDAARDIAYFPNGYDPLDPNAIPHTNLIFDGITTTVSGAGLQMLAGYEGKGKGSAGGGGEIRYNIYSQQMGRSNSESVLSITWHHIIGLELEGRY